MGCGRANGEIQVSGAARSAPMEEGGGRRAWVSSALGEGLAVLTGPVERRGGPVVSSASGVSRFGAVAAHHLFDGSSGGL
jgi:hypothetical protein